MSTELRGTEVSAEERNELARCVGDAMAPATAPIKGKRALVTGATAGIGLALAVQLAREGVALVLVGRREGRLAWLKSELAERCPGSTVEVACGDVRERSFLQTLDERRLLDVDIFVDNAGLARGRDPVSAADPMHWDEMLDTNVTAAFHLTRLVLPHMLRRGRGHILALSSVAAHVAYEGGSVYCATKHALRAFHQCLRQETCGQNIRVTMLSPGMVETEFSVVRLGDKEAAKAVYQGFSPLVAADIARQAIWALTQPEHVNIDELIVLPTAQGSATKVVRNAGRAHQN